MDQAAFDKMAEDSDVTWRTYFDSWRLFMIANIFFGGVSSLTYLTSDALEKPHVWMIFLVLLFLLALLSAKLFWLPPIKMAFWSLVVCAPSLVAFIGVSIYKGVPWDEVALRTLACVAVILVTVFVRRALWRASAEEALEKKSDADGEAA